MEIHNIPEELTKRPQEALLAWGVHKDKIPYSPKAKGKGRRPIARVNQPETWGTFEQALETLAKGRFDGLAFALWESDPYCLIDLDDCRNPETGVIEPQALQIVKNLNSYTEVSPSGAGLHILTGAKRPRDEDGKPLDARESGRKKPVTWDSGKEGWVEVYDHAHYVCMTGWHLDSSPRTIEDRQAELEALYWDLWPVTAEIVAKPETNLPALFQALEFPDQRVINMCRRAANGAKFSRLFSGDWEGVGYSSQSEADLALCAMLAFFTRDPEQIGRIVSGSGLNRHKWNRPDYRQRTIAKALELVDKGYDPNYDPVPDGPVWVSIENDPDDKPQEVSFPLAQSAPKDLLYLLPNGGLSLRLDRQGVVKEILEAGLQAKLQPLLEPLLEEAWVAFKELANSPGLTEETASAGLKEIGAKLNCQVRHALDRFYRKYLTFAIAINPVTRTALEAIHSGGPKPMWDSDSHGRPVYKGKRKGYRITISFESMPDGDEVIEALWDLVKELSVETGDVFLILLGALTELGDPKAETATIRPEDIAQYRGVGHRHGSVKKLHEDLKDQVLRIAKLRLTMTWEDKHTGKTIIFGKDAPEPLIHIVDWQYGKDGKNWTAFELRPGQALTYFLTHGEGVRWIGYYSKALLRLNPYHEELTKKVGAFWIMMGEVSAKGGNNLKASVGTLFKACGLPLNPKRPDKAVSAIKKAHQRLWEIGVLAKVSDLEPENRKAGYFQRWLRKVVTVKLNPALFEVRGAKRYPGVCKVSREPTSPPQLSRLS